MMRHTLLILMLLICEMSASAQLTLKSEKGDFEARLIGRALFDGGVFFSDKTSLGNAVEMSAWGRWFVFWKGGPGRSRWGLPRVRCQ